MLKPEGIIVPLITPMNEDESINEAELRNQVNRMIAQGINGIFALGTNGESYAMTYEEKLKVLAIVVDEANHRVPIYAGTGCVGTKHTIELSRQAQRIGADALSIVSPYYVGVSQEDIYRHYRTIADAVDLPIILYNIPARTGNVIAYKTVARLAASCANIVGLKDSSGNFDQTLRFIENTDRRLHILAGNDSLILWTLVAGGKGAIAGWANVYPKLLLDIYALWKKGEIDAANEKQASIRPLRDAMQLGNPNSVVKRAMQLLGFPVGPAREPATGLTPEIDAALKAAFPLYQSYKDRE